MSASTRPPVKRQYGSRKNTTTTTPSFSSQSSTYRSSPSTSSASSTPILPRVRSSQPSSEWNDLLDDVDSSYVASTSGRVETPPTSPEVAQKRPEVEMEVGGEASTSAATPARQLRERRESIKLAPKALPTDLRSFFGKVSPRKRALAESDEEGTQKSVARVGRRKVSSGSTSSADSKPKLATKPAKKMEQLFLDPFDTMGHATLSCAVCAMSYARTPEDMELHTKHHKKVVGGCDWVLGDAKGVTVLDEGVDWNENQGGKIVMVDAGAGGLVGKRIKDVLATIDTELSSTQLTSSQLVECKLFLFLTPQRKVIACAVVQRIQCAYRVVSSKALSSPQPKADLLKADLLRFGEQESAIFCSPDPLPTLLGVHRIWTSSSHRNAGLATLLLDAAAQRFIYGCPIPKQRRALDVAFSQPTGAGMALARSWTGTDAFRVFVE